MNNGSSNRSNDFNLDLLPHKYRPQCSTDFSCHLEQTKRLKEWVQEFSRSQTSKTSSDSELEDDDEDELVHPKVATKCVLLSGPPGVGKTSLVYALADELKLHVIESHSSEKRDFKLFSMLKQTNQKGKINPIARLFHNTQSLQETRRKKRKLAENNNNSNGQINNQQVKLSVSGDSSILLFDDIDVTFEDDGPFLKSLVEFIQESKRPIILTATKSIEHIKDILIHCEHIHLQKPYLEDCTRLLKRISKLEHYNELSKSSRCRKIANKYNCDIRQCLNSIHFYGNQAHSLTDLELDTKLITPDISRLDLMIDNAETLSLTDFDRSNQFILSTYDSRSVVDLLDSGCNLLTETSLLNHWLSGRPSIRNESHGSEHELGEQIKGSIIELTTKLYHDKLRTQEDLFKSEQMFMEEKDSHMNLSNRINEVIKSRIEPPLDHEFFTEIVPSFCELVKSEARHRSAQHICSNGNRRSRRVLSYLDYIQVYLEPTEFNEIANRVSSIDEVLLEDDQH